MKRVINICFLLFWSVSIYAIELVTCCVEANAGAGNIELAITAKGRKSQIITHVGYTTSYNSNWLIPNWVAYGLTAREVEGTYPRPKKQFEPDPMVKGRSATHRDYSNSGYSRGHMAPAADMKWNEKAMLESFYLSNICPQIAELNGGVWERLENRCRALASDGEVFICCGPIVDGTPARIGESRVAVPVGFFKVMCMRRKGKWQAIGFVFPNKACKGSMFNYACSVDDVEKLTGHDFFYNLPDDIENRIEATWSVKDWQ
jgi:endonuclease G